MEDPETLVRRRFFSGSDRVETHSTVTSISDSACDLRKMSHFPVKQEEMDLRTM
jgi:hypothetical protein